MAEKARHLRVADGKNPYAGIGASEYDPDEFYVKTVQDNHGHSAQKRVRLHPDTMSQITVWLATGHLAGTPINSWEGFMRDAVAHQLHRLARVLKSPEIAAAAERETRRAKADMTAAEIEDAKRILNEARERFDLALRDDDPISLEEFIDIYSEIAPTLRMPYSKRLDDEITAVKRRMVTR